MRYVKSYLERGSKNYFISLYGTHFQYGYNSMELTEQLCISKLCFDSLLRPIFAINVLFIQSP